jgi:hypothetical protein
VTRITRRLVAREAEKVFANSPGFNAAVTMVGREAPRRKLASIAAGEVPTRTVRLSDLLGAGKTFFLQSAVNQLSTGGLIDEATEYLHLDYREIDTLATLEKSPVRMLVIDELDRKAQRDELLAAIETAKSWQREDRVLILTGDYSLKNDDLVSTVGELEPLELEPLDEVLLIRAMTARLAKALRQVDPHGDVEAEAHEAAEGLFDPELLAVLLPPTDPPVATFREVLGIMQRFANVLSMDDEPCTFTPDMYRQVTGSEGTRRRPPAQVEFLESLYAEIRARRAAGEPFPQMEAPDFPWVDLDEEKVEDYERTVVDALIRAKLLLPMGVPYAPPSQRRTPGPYLPTVRAFLNASFLDET